MVVIFARGQKDEVEGDACHDQPGDEEKKEGEGTVAENKDKQEEKVDGA